MKKNIKNIYIIFSILLLIVIFLNQAYLIKNRSYSGYIFERKSNSERVNFDYIVLAYNLSFIKEIIPEDSSVSIYFSERDLGYDDSYWWFINRTLIYPISMPVNYRGKTLEDYDDEELINQFKNDENEYVVIIGKNTKKLNIKTTKDISVYKVNGDYSLSLIDEYSNTLYNIENMSKKYNKDYYNLTTKYVDNYLNSYAFRYGYKLYNYLYDYAVDLDINGRKEEARKYYDIYLSLPAFDGDIVNKQINIYSMYNDYENLKDKVEICNNLEDCNSETASIILAEMEEKLNDGTVN